MQFPTTGYQTPSLPLHTMLFRPSRLSLPNKLSPFPERPALYQFDSGSSVTSTLSTSTITSDTDDLTTPTAASANRPSFIHPFASSAEKTIHEPDVAVSEPGSPSFFPRDRAPSLPIFPTARSCSLVEAAQSTKSAHKHLIFSLNYDPPTRFPTSPVDEQRTPRLDCVDIQAEKDFEEEQLADIMRLQAPVLPTKNQFSPGLISPHSPYGNPFDKIVKPIIRSPSPDSSDEEDGVPTFTFDSPGGKTSGTEDEVMELDLDPSLDPEPTEAEKREEERRRNLWRSVRSQSDGGLGINFGLVDFDIGISLETLYRRHSAGGVDRKHTRLEVTRDPDLFEGWDIRSQNRTPVQEDMKGVDPLVLHAEQEDVDMDAHDGMEAI